MTRVIEIDLSGYSFDVDKGIVIGLLGRPVGYVHPTGYVVIKRGGKNVGTAHRMLWTFVHGPIAQGIEINHINGIKTDNRIINLEAVTPKENSLHAYRTGLSSAVGERNGRAKLTALDVRIIRWRAASESARKLAYEYGVSRRTVRDVISRRNWSQVA